MSLIRVLPGVIAVAGGVLLAFLLFVPFVFGSYRRRGEVGLGPALLAFAFVVYGLALVAYTLLPVPELDAAWCAAHVAATRPQLDLLRFLSDIASQQQSAGVTGFVANPAVQQVVFNVALFVPLGAYLGHYFRRGKIAAVLGGFGVSLFIECTQLTGNWFLFPCPYRLFDVDDLLANTLGSAFGLLFVPVVSRLARHTGPADVAHPVTTRRRLLGMLVDFVSVFLLGGFCTAAGSLVERYLGGQPAGQALSPFANCVLGAWLPALLLLAVPSFGGDGATLGQRAVRLRRIRADGTRSGRRIVPALLAGGFGYWLLFGAGRVVPVANLGAGLLLIACLVFARRPSHHRGLSGVVSQLSIVDSRGESATTVDLPVTRKEIIR
ncbi:MAG TPA: VanZ family protein [Amycolatopsis sp.]|nr:VanZ family protein [Amycolatopsis sp.]